MPEKTLTEKMKLKLGQQATVVNALSGYLDQLSTLREADVSLRLESEPFDWVPIFVRSKAELESIAPQLLNVLKPNSLLWITFPKERSKIQTDLTRDQGWDIIQALDLKWINLISVNQTWSAFSLRPYKPGEKRQSFR